MKIYSPHVISLTLVDLPGMTRVPVGDQPADIEQQIRKMIMEFISKPTAIILAVTAANTDLANSDALNLAKLADPDGSRTIGVLTKLDLMDRGTNGMDMLLGKVIPLQLGYVGVVNRSQEDIAAKLPIRDALRKEAAFFKSHPLYRTISTRCGTAFLARNLNKILMHHIRDSLPELKSKINKMLSEAQAELTTYGDPIYAGAGSRGALLLQIITKFCTNFSAAIDGNLTTLSTTELYGGARINFIFNEIFGACLARIDPLAGLSLADVKTTIRNATGPKAALFVPESSFELLVKRQIARLKEPSLQCVDLVYDELQRIVAQIETKELARFGALRQQVIEVVGRLLHSLVEPTKRMISDLIAIELAFINTSHPDFVGGDGALSNILDKMVEEKLAAQKAESERAAAAAAAQPAGASSSQKAAAAARAERSKPPPAASGSGSSGNGGIMSMLFGGGKSSSSSSSSGAASSGKGAAGGAAANRASPKLAPVPASIKPGAGSNEDKSSFEIELIKNLLTSYYDLVRVSLCDGVTKSVIHFLVNRSKDSIQNELVRALYKDELLDELLAENPQVAERRAACVEMIAVLEKARSIINEVRDLGGAVLL